MLLKMVCLILVAIIVNCCCAILAQSANFFEIRKSAEYVDKSLLVKEVLSHTQPLVLAAPSGFGKSANLDMIRVFLSNTIDRKIAENAFHGTTISKNDEFMKTHHGNYPVIYCSFKPSSKVTYYDSILEVFRNKLHEVFLQHKYLVDSPHLSKHELEELQHYISEDGNKKLKPLQISVGLYFLSQIIHKHLGIKAILLIDDYDSIILDSIFTKGLHINEVLGFHNTLLSGTLLNNDHVQLSILAGTTCISLDVLSDLKGLNCVRFLQDKTFEPYFGFTEAEVDELLRREDFKIHQGKKDEVKMWYGGYTDNDLHAHIYNTKSVVSFLRTGEVKCYWQETREEAAFRLLVQDRVSKQLMSESAQGVMIVVRTLTNTTLAHLEGLKYMALNQFWNEEFSDLYIHLLMERGYFTFDTPWERSGYKNPVTVKFPNLEVCEYLRQIIAVVIEEAKNQKTNEAVNNG